MREPISWRWLGLCAYDDAVAVQAAAWHARRRGAPDICFALEHPPTITFGRRTAGHDLRATTAELARRGITCHATERGGGATYHAPGQLVIYPIVDLAARGLGVRTFVWWLEEIMIEIARRVGVASHRDARGRGVWTARGKLGALGIRVREGVSTHGLALNVDLDLSGYALITPCGTPNLPVTSLRREGADVAVADLVAIARDTCGRIFTAGGAERLEEAAV